MALLLAPVAAPHLADAGWGAVITFPLGDLERADSLSWAVGAQWGTLEQVASGTTSKDNAPDGGWAPLPG